MRGFSNGKHFLHTVIFMTILTKNRKGTKKQKNK